MALLFVWLWRSALQTGHSYITGQLLDPLNPGYDMGIGVQRKLAIGSKPNVRETGDVGDRRAIARQPLSGCQMVINYSQQRIRLFL
jgi:hypothetical protein